MKLRAIAALISSTFLLVSCKITDSSNSSAQNAKIENGFSAGSNMLSARTYVHCYKLANGNALVLGSFQKEIPEIYDYKKNQFYPATAAEVKGPKPILAKDGTVWLCGQQLSPEIDPLVKLSALSKICSNYVQYSQHVLLPNGQVFWAGGFIVNADGSRTTSDKAEIYDVRKGSAVWTGKLKEGRFNFTATLLNDGRILIAGGQKWGSNSGLTSTEIFNIKTRDFEPGPKLSCWRYDHKAVLLKDGRVLLLCGVAPSSPTQKKYSEVFDPKSNTITATGPQVFGHTGTATVVLPSGNVLTCGSMTGSDDAQLFLAAENRFINVGPMCEPRAWPGACVLEDGAVLIAGGQHVAGVSDETPPLKSTELFRESEVPLPKTEK